MNRMRKLVVKGQSQPKEIERLHREETAVLQKQLSFLDNEHKLAIKSLMVSAKSFRSRYERFITPVTSCSQKQNIENSESETDAYAVTSPRKVLLRPHTTAGGYHSMRGESGDIKQNVGSNIRGNASLRNSVKSAHPSKVRREATKLSYDNATWKPSETVPHNQKRKVWLLNTAKSLPVLERNKTPRHHNSSVPRLGRKEAPLPQIVVCDCSNGVPRQETNVTEVTHQNENDSVAEPLNSSTPLPNFLQSKDLLRMIIARTSGRSRFWFTVKLAQQHMREEREKRIWREKQNKLALLIKCRYLRLPPRLRKPDDDVLSVFRD